MYTATETMKIYIVHQYKQKKYSGNINWKKETYININHETDTMKICTSTDTIKAYIVHRPPLWGLVVRVPGGSRRS
jgi:hypothetical protein